MNIELNNNNYPISLLILENEPKFMEIVNYMSNDNICYTESDPQRALALYKDFKPPIIMISDSFESEVIKNITKDILDINPHAFIILLVKKGNGINKEKLDKANIHYCIIKPFSRKTLNKYISIYCSQNKKLSYE